MILAKQDRFLSVIETNKGIIYKVANAYCKDGENRKDLVQEIIVQLWQSFDQYNEQFKHSTWIYRVALNVAISFYRKDTRRQAIALPMSDDSLLTLNEAEPDDTEGNIDLLQRFLGELNELDRALMLLYLEERSHQQIAEILGLSSSNVATKISRIKEQLKRKFSTIKA
ncbi:RNA polymerase sigma factor [Spirosoma endbachense]|uniref:Sigma-70 family RNA polymerase sigma factor n=1 Tax=Spirosoma endbachense TaxID=2666025 RepID=A0A6P1W0I8_9BACT|nr:RNA polymerase sigma factor [Spirosoma endbachense]QHV97520.1 sigma-70 family RNA polymerase sigma factor [Spirosoma endbachense]